jgi:cytochrome d ubiquinol oxidase subunit I
MLLVVTWSAIQWKRGLLMRSPLLLKAWAAMTPAGFIAILAGWYTTEIGRQPYVIYGLMRTEEAASVLNPYSVMTSLVVFATVYLFIFVAGTYYLLKLLRKGPQPVEDAMRIPDEAPLPEDKRPARPLSVPDEAVEH